MRRHSSSSSCHFRSNVSLHTAQELTARPESANTVHTLWLSGEELSQLIDSRKASKSWMQSLNWEKSNEAKPAANIEGLFTELLLSKKPALSSSSSFTSLYSTHKSMV